MTNIYNLFCGLMLVAVVAGCGNEMRSAHTENSLGSSESSSLGKLAWENSSESGEFAMTYDLRIPYGRVFKGVSKVVDLMSPRLCQSLTPGQNYQNGEVPCGRILDSNWKEMTVVNVERSESKSSGYDITVNAFNIPIWMSRQAYQGPYMENSLDVKKEIQKMSSLEFGKDISMKWTPNNNSVKMEMCMNIPGGKLTAPQVEVFARARKKTWYGHFSTSSDFQITPGSLTWQYGRGCFEVNYLKYGAQNQSQVLLSTTKAPYLHAVQYSGLKIRIQDWFLRLIDNIMSIFNASIRKSIIKKVTNSVNTIADRDVESGQWFSKVYTDQVLLEHGQRMNEKIRQLVERSGSFIQVDNVRTLVKDNCRLIKMSRSPSWTTKLQRFCTEVAQTLKITITPIARDAESSAAGCYDSFANIHGVKDSTGKDKWWAKQCRFAVRFKVSMSQNAKDYADELHETLLKQIDELRIPGEWKEVLESFNVDEMALNLILEEAEKRGFQDLSVEDLKKELPALLAQIKQ